MRWLFGRQQQVNMKEVEIHVNFNFLGIILVKYSLRNSLPV